MSDHTLIRRLVEEILESGRSPEDVCSDYPELLPAVRDRWKQVQAVEAQVDALFPPSDGHSGTPTMRSTTPGSHLPTIPGYEVQAVLGHGGVGVVYRAHHIRLDRPVAIKMLLSGAYAGAQERTRFEREAQAVATLLHPNIVQIYDVGEFDGRPYFTMELVGGGTLSTKLGGAPLPAAQAASLAATLAKGVQAAHERGIVHRDLKPANVLLAGDGTPKISDFGLARRLDDDASLTLTGARIGTPSYMAPEQAIGKGADCGPSVDIYSLGALLYEMLTGRPPFRAESPAETQRQVIFEVPATPRRLNAKVPRDLQTICLKCLQKTPERRYLSAQALADDLDRSLRGEPILARPVSKLERIFRWARRKPSTTGLLVAVTLLLAVVIGGIWLLQQQKVVAHARQIQTDLEVRGVIQRARGSLETAWQAANIADLTATEADATRAVDIARSGGASALAQQEAAAFQKDAAERLDRAKKDHALLQALLDVSYEEPTAQGNASMAAMLLSVEPSADEEYAATFRQWGLDVDDTPEDEVVARLRNEPAAIVEELIAGLDAWATVRREQNVPDAAWQRLHRIADQLDPDELRRRLRVLLSGESLTPAQVDDELARIIRQIDPAKERSLTLVLVAQTCAAAGDNTGAVEILSIAATARPNETVLHCALGQLLERQQPPRLEDAIGYYRAARAQRHNLGIRLSRALVRVGRVVEGEQVLRELIRLQPENAVFHFHFGVILKDQEKFADAAAAYRKAVTLNPGFAWGYIGLAGALNELQRFSEAEKAARRAVELRPDLAQAHNNLGGALYNQRKYVDAEATYRQTIAMAPDIAEPYHNLGNTLRQREAYDEAEQAYRKAIQLKPDYSQAYYNLGYFFGVQDKHAEAEAAYRKAVELKPDYALAHYAVGGCLFERGAYYEAELEYREAVKCKPEFADAHYNLGVALLKQNQFQKGVDSVNRAAHLFRPGDPRAAKASKLVQEYERRAALEARLPEVLQGSDKPVSAEEQIEFALLSRDKKLNAAAMRLFADAFSTSPQLAEDGKTRNRYDAACVAALAGLGVGTDASNFDDDQRAPMREQARRWLIAELDVKKAILAEAPGSERAALPGQIDSWLKDPALSGLREEIELRKLPSEEHEAWLQVWHDVNALLAESLAATSENPQ